MTSALSRSNCTVSRMLPMTCLGLAIAFCFFTNSEGAVTAGHTSWGYYSSQNSVGPQDWKQSYPECGGRAQSPVDLPVSQAIQPTGMPGLNLRGWDAKPAGLTITNNGHTASAKVTGNYTVNGLYLPGTFQVDGFHFHWGSNNRQGSEHRLEGQTFPIEMHIVMWNTAFRSLSNAATKLTGLAVIAVFLEIGQYEEIEHQMAFGAIEEAISTIIKPGSTNTVPLMFSLNDVLPDDLYPLYHYHGSLTTPKCYETVSWLVIEEPVTVSSTFITTLRSLQDSHGMPLVDNFRPVQPLNGRPVAKCCLS